MSRLSTLADGNLIGQTVELINGNDVILDGTYVKADGRQLDKADYPELYAMKGDTVEGLSSYDISSSNTRNALYINSIGGLENPKPLTVTLDGKFITVGFRPSSRMEGASSILMQEIAVSSSDDGESWTVPSYSIPDRDTFIGIRAFSTGVFIITNVGVYRSVDYGKTFEPVFTGTTLYDIAFDGVSTYVVTGYNNPNSIYYGDILIGDMAKANVGGNLNSVVWTGTNFIACVDGLTTTYKSTNGVVWSAGGNLKYTYISSGFHGNRLYYVNDTLVAFTDTRLFSFSTNDGVSWTESVDYANADFSAQSIAYSDGLYYVLDRLNVRVYTTLNSASTVYTMPSLTLANNYYFYTSITFNGTKLLYEVKDATTNQSHGYIHVGDSAPTGNISSNKILGHIFSKYTRFGGGNTLITAIKSGTFYIGMYRYSNGLFVPVKYSPTQYYFTTLSYTDGIFHYAKDAKILYYTKVDYIPIAGTTAVTLYRREVDFDTGVFGNEVEAGSFIKENGITNVFGHTNGIYFHHATNPVSFFGKLRFTYTTTGTGDYVFVSYDGMEILSKGNTAPISYHYSTNGGKSFVKFMPICYDINDAVITDGAQMMYKLGGKFYSTSNSLEGDTPFRLSYKKGVPKTSVPYQNLMQVTEDIIISNTSGKIEKIGDDIIPTQTLQSGVSVAWITEDDGSITINGTIMKFYTSIVKDNTKFRISKLSPSTASKAVYIKAK